MEVNNDRKKKKYQAQFKIDAVKLVTKQGYNVSEAARSLGIHLGVLRRWKNQLTSGDAQAFPGFPVRTNHTLLRRTCLCNPDIMIDHAKWF